MVAYRQSARYEMSTHHSEDFGHEISSEHELQTTVYI